MPLPGRSRRFRDCCIGAVEQAIARIRQAIAAADREKFRLQSAPVPGPELDQRIEDYGRGCKSTAARWSRASPRASRCRVLWPLRDSAKRGNSDGFGFAPGSA